MYSKKRKSPAASTYPGTPIRKYAPSRAEMPLNKKQKAQIGRMLSTKTELKTFDFDAKSAQSIDTAGTIFSISEVPQGVTDITRVGDSLLPKRLEIRMLQIGADTPSNTMRILLFRWKMNDASDTPGVSEIFEGGYAGSYVFSPYNTHNRKRFEVLWDDTVVLNPNVASTTNTQWRTKYFKLAKKPIDYQYSAVTGQDKIFLLVISDSSAISHPTIQFISRMYFTDS